MHDSDSFELESIKLPKIFRKSWKERIDNTFLSILISSIILHGAFIGYFLINPISEESALNKIAKMQKHLVKNITEREIKIDERLAKFKFSSKAEEQEEAVEEPAADEPEKKTAQKQTSGSKPQAQSQVAEGTSQRSARKPRRTKRQVEEAVGSKGILGLLTSSGSAAKGQEVQDILGTSSRSQRDLDKTLSGLSGVKTAGTSGNGIGSGSNVRGGRSEAGGSIDDLVAGLDEAKSGSFKRSGKLVVVSEKSQIESSAGKGGVGRSYEGVAGVVLQHNRSIQYCYERELKRNPLLKGKLVIRFTITPEGMVKNVEIVSSTLDNRNVEQCVGSRIRRWNDFGVIDSSYGDTTIRQVYAFGY